MNRHMSSPEFEIMDENKLANEQHYGCEIVAIPDLRTKYGSEAGYEIGSVTVVVT